MRRVDSYMRIIDVSLFINELSGLIGYANFGAALVALFATP